MSAQMLAVGDAMPAPASGTSTYLSRPSLIDPPVVRGAELQQQDTCAPKHKTCTGCQSTSTRNLVVCIDGTSNQFSTKNTNVVELYSRLIKDDRQLTFYNSGIGTYAKPSWKSWSYRKQVLANKLDLAFALRLEKIIISAYAWLVDNYKRGDRIFFFGFSRGAYQVRALAAMIDTVGLLHKGNDDQIPFAYELYAASGDGECSPSLPMPLSTPSRAASDDRRSKMTVASSSSVEQVTRADSSIATASDHGTGEPLPTFPKPPAMARPRAEAVHVEPMSMQKQFKATFSRHVHVHFVGAWDTVSSVGLVRDKTLPATTDGMKFVCFFRHALALHEYRVKFLPEYAHGARGPDPELPRAGFAEPHTKEVWFSGSHSDIGGGSTANTTLDKFGPALRWMSWEAMLAGLRLDNSPPDWETIGVTTSMTHIWRVIECLPIKHLSYEDPVKEGPCSPSKQPFTRLPHFCANRRIKPHQRIHQSVYDECGKFAQPELVEREPDAYIAAEDILRPLEEVLRSGRVLDAPHNRRLDLLLYSAQGIRSLRKVDLFQYIYDTARSCRNAEGNAQILRDLQTLHAAYVMACFKVDREGDMDRRHAADVTDLTSSATFPFHVCGHTRGVSSVTFSSPTRVVSGSWDTTIRVWDVGTGEMNIGTPLDGHRGNINCVAAASGLVASASDDASICLWMHVINGAPHTENLKVLQDETKTYVLAVAFSPDGLHLVSGSTDGAIRSWDTTTGRRVGHPKCEHEGSVHSVAFSPDGTKIATGSADRTVRVWQWSPGEATALPLAQPRCGHTDAVYSVAFSPDACTIASGSADKSVRLWDIITGSLKFTLAGHIGIVRSVAFEPSGRHVVSGSHDWTVRIWDIRTGAAVRVLRGHTDRVMSVAFSPDGTRIASGSRDKTLRVWDFVPTLDESRLDDEAQASVLVPHKQRCAEDA